MEKEALEIIRKLNNAGYEAYIVGGYVRDKIIGKKCKDIDLCSNATPKQIAELFPTVAFAGEKYGTSMIKLKNNTYEITTYRKELHYLKNRTPENIEYIDHIDDDLIRRDFIINAICINNKGQIYDPLNGIKEMTLKRIKTIGDADFKISSDSLRILRAIRFATVLDFELDDDLSKSIIKYKDNLTNIAKETIKEEIDKILFSPNKMKGINLIKKYHLTRVLHLTIPRNIVDTELLGMYAQLKIDQYYPLTKHEKISINEINMLVNKDNITKMDLINSGIYIVKIAATIKGINLNLIEEMYKELPLKSLDELHVTGDDICRILDINPSPTIKAIKEEVLNEVVYNNLKNNRKAIKNFLLENKDKWYNNE